MYVDTAEVEHSVSRGVQMELSQKTRPQAFSDFFFFAVVFGSATGERGEIGTAKEVHGGMVTRESKRNGA